MDSGQEESEYFVFPGNQQWQTRQVLSAALYWLQVLQIVMRRAFSSAETYEAVPVSSARATSIRLKVLFDTDQS